MHLQLPSSSRVNSLVPTTPEGASSGAELVTSDGRSLALVSAQLRGEARGGIARLVLEQRFVNSYDENLSVTYRMPLPADGAVSGYEFEIGDRVIKGVIDRKRAAREKFERAIASGHTAALLEQERADIFTQQLGNIPANATLLARITIDQRLVWLPEGEWELRFPTVIGPRYIGSADTAADVRATHLKVTAQPLGASIQIAIHVRDQITGGARPNSPSHSLVQRADGVTELHAGARLDRDIVMRWPVAAPSPGLSLATAMTQQGAFGLLTIVPPARHANVTPVARDLLVLLDTSGSMSGGPLDKAKQVVCMMLDSLAEADRFELIEFSSEPRRYSPEPIMATAKAKQKAIQWVRSRCADGGTEMRAAVIESLAALRVGAQRQVVVVTDGYVGGEQQIIEAINRRLPTSCRVHVLGVGSAVNRSLATAIARAGKGAEVIVGLDEDAERGAKRLLDRTSMPMLTNVEISGSALLRHAPERIPDVFEGAPLVAALAVKPEGGELVIRGQTAREAWTQTIAVPAQRIGDGDGAIVQLYGRERVADVEANSVFATSDGEIEELGLMFQIATKMTSWVAVDESRTVTGPTRDQLIPQELPYGTRAESFGLRAGGRPSPAMRTRSGVMLRLELDAVSTRNDVKESSFEDTAETAPGAAYDAFEEDSSIRSSAAMMSPRSYVAQLETDGDFETEEPTGQSAARLVDLDDGADLAVRAPMERLESPPGGPGRAAGATIPEPFRANQPGPDAPAQIGVAKPVAPAEPAPISDDAVTTTRRTRPARAGGMPSSSMPRVEPKVAPTEQVPAPQKPWRLLAIVVALLVGLLLWWLAR